MSVLMRVSQPPHVRHLGFGILCSLLCGWVLPGVDALVFPTPTPSPSSAPTQLIILSSGSLSSDAVSCGVLENCPNASLHLQGSNVRSLCSTMTSAQQLTSSWTSATLLRVNQCSNTNMSLYFDVRSDPAPWFWERRSLSFQQVGIFLEPIRMSLRTPATSIGWREIIQLRGPGIGLAAPQFLVFVDKDRINEHVSPSLAGPSRAVCIATSVENVDTLSCKVLTLPQPLVGRNASVQIAVGSATGQQGTHSSYQFSFTPFDLSNAPAVPSLIVRKVPMLAPTAISWTGPKLLSPNGGDLLSVSLPNTPIEANDGRYLSTALTLWVGNASTSCSQSGLDARVVECSAPRGWGINLTAALVIGDTTVVKLPHYSVSYGPPVMKAIDPVILLLAPQGSGATTQIAFRFIQNMFLEHVENIVLCGVACTEKAFRNGDGLVFCNVSSDALVSAASGADEMTCTISFTWLGQLVPDAGQLRTIVRPVVSSIAPSTVTSGSMMVIFGKNFCSTEGCSAASAGKGGGNIRVIVGTRPCTAVTVLLDTLLTCIAPNSDVYDEGYPDFQVVVINEPGAYSTELQTVTYPATATVGYIGDKPTRFIPSDDTSPWYMEEELRVQLFTRTGNQSQAYTGPIRCTVASMVSTASLLPDFRAGNTLIDVESGDGGVVNFGKIAVQMSSFTAKEIQAQVSCVSENTEIASANALSFVLSVIDLAVAVCSLPEPKARAQAVLSPWSVAVALTAQLSTACNQTTVPAIRLPVVTCAVSAVSPTGAPASVQGNAINIEPASWTGTFRGMSLSGAVDTAYTASVNCLAGSVAIPGYGTQFSIYISGCSPGSEPTGTGCVACQPNFYSEGGNHTCIACPKIGARCSNGLITLEPGYFRPPSQLALRLDANAELHPCGLPSGCLVDNTNKTYACNLGYTGVLCGLCDENSDYSLVGSTCVKCMPSQANAALVISGAVVLLLGLSVFVVRQTGAGKRSHFSIAFRILLTHVQAISMLRTFKLAGSAVYKMFMSWTDILSPLVFSQGPTQCLVRPSFALVFYATILAPLIASAAALTVLAFVILFQGYREWRRSNSPWGPLREKLRGRKHLAILLFVGHLAYMPIVSSALSVFRCTSPVDGTQYLLRDLREPCTGSTYLLFASTAIAVLVSVGIGFPAIIFWSFRRATLSTLQDGQFHSTFGFLYDGYRTPAHDFHGNLLKAAMQHTPPEGQHRHGTNLVWWEALVLVRKAGIVLIANLIGDAGGQISAVIVWNIIFLVLHVRYVPYTHHEFFIVEGLSIFTICVTAAIAVVSDSSNIDSVASLVATIFMMGINLVAMIVLLRAVVNALVHDWRARKNAQLHKKAPPPQPSAIPVPTTVPRQIGQFGRSPSIDSVRRIPSAALSQRHLAMNPLVPGEPSPVSPGTVSRQDVRQDPAGSVHNSPCSLATGVMPRPELKQVPSSRSSPSQQSVRHPYAISSFARSQFDQ